jgi:Fic family protein
MFFMNELTFSLSSDIVKLIAEIDEFKGRWDALKVLSPERLNALKHTATIESIGSSTRIEGVTLTDFQVETLLSNLQISSFKSRDEQEVVGYAEAMDLVFQAHAELRPTENHIKQLHQLLLKHSPKDERHRGRYKTLTNHVVAKDAQGVQVGVVFDTTTPFDTPREMEALVHWLNKAVQEESFHPLLLVAVFVVRFLAIHPFQDGNGRLSRILTTLLLLRAGYAYVPYASLEHVIEENKDLYYKALRRTQLTFKSTQADWEPWLGFFLRCLKKQKDRLQQRLDKEHQASIADDALPSLSVEILKLLTLHERLTIAEIVKLTNANQNTLKVRLRELVELCRIQRFGKARATWYRLAQLPFQGF